MNGNNNATRSCLERVALFVIVCYLPLFFVAAM